MKVSSVIVVLVAFLQWPAFSQTTKNDEPYTVRPVLDGAITLGGGLLSLAGLELILKEKPTLDSAYVLSLTPAMVNRFDRPATQQNSEKASGRSDISLFASFALPIGLMLDPEIRQDAGKVGLMYLETMSVMGVAYTWGAGLIYKNRPYVYNPEVPFSKKLRKGTTNSFFAGHPAAAAAATFFAAKVFHDYNPDSKLNYVLFPAAAIPPAIVAYYRYRNGMHFPTDIAVGIPLGAAIGIIVPQLHKKRKADSALSVSPYLNGLSLCYRIK